VLFLIIDRTGDVIKSNETPDKHLKEKADDGLLTIIKVNGYNVPTE